MFLSSADPPSSLHSWIYQLMIKINLDVMNSCQQVVKKHKIGGWFKKKKKP